MLQIWRIRAMNFDIRETGRRIRALSPPPRAPSLLFAFGFFPDGKFTMGLYHSVSSTMIYRIGRVKAARDIINDDR